VKCEFVTRAAWMPADRGHGHGDHLLRCAGLHVSRGQRALAHNGQREAQRWTACIVDVFSGQLKIMNEADEYTYVTLRDIPGVSSDVDLDSIAIASVDAAFADVHPCARVVCDLIFGAYRDVASISTWS
jgi:hypothetical protein